ncbi:uncharacterized protein EV420DRAFT_1475828 [Desarmillaria tabescens]|uniref:Protein kinase domain-containing protein n=1 Tax=Armillaria tabescens TaxID=1929756 RepID=A0AA39T4L5_ARMTA|nr:uncharacterized protein EV420DRAFT_1475828 [Desarmillaria tabescens]KAK0464336.1 hypothetical protein EV420DRAFT_1475828 [Desarmillaria tabescens]
MVHGVDILIPGEVFWCDHSARLKECGYELRRRFQPDWAPSWIGAKKDSGIYMDAKDTSTGQIVAMKIIVHEDSPDELAIGTLLSSGERSSNNRNHCVSILRTLPIPNREGEVIIVMPYLRARYDLKFKAIGEGVKFFKEMLEMYGPDSFHPQE